MPKINSNQIKKNTGIKFFDGFTKVLLAVMITILVFIFISAKYMASHHMTVGATDDAVNNLASAVSHTAHHPFIQLTGDAQLGAFSVANFFAGLIVGHHWEKLFGKSKSKKESEQKETNEENKDVIEDTEQHKDVME